MQVKPKPEAADRLTRANAPKTINADKPAEPTDSERLTELQRQVAELSEQLTRTLAREET